jgi:hypothetical protein
MDFIRGNEIYNHLESTVDRLEPSPAGWIGPVPLSCACWQTGAGPPGNCRALAAFIGNAVS